ncbi:MAG: DUF2298 domain-containing protein [Chloroflexota bacterium]|nr:DUF2298 domain-containing protein [Chloroflexota bacterium]MDE2960296.1 DUF2298 domain-containing protein [Chloroflexota bacterium]
MQDILAWLIALWALSLVGFPIASTVCGLGRLADRGWAVSRVLALLALAWVTWIGGTLGIIPNSPAGIAAVLVIMGVAAAWLAYRQRAELADFFRRRWAVVTTTELTFLVIFAFWALVISEVPAINHTEKPMDFGILNAVANADRFPPEDQWLSGHSVAYYYGGHYVAAMLSTLTGVATDKAYNLAVATIPALLAAGILGLVYNVLRLAGARAFPALGAGLLTAVGITMLGNLSGVLELAYVRGVGADWFWEWVAIKGLEPPAGPIGQGIRGWLPEGFWWWWRGTRVIDTLTETGTSLDYTITEVPFFSFLLGDLHAHVSALPFVTLALTLTLALLVSPFAPGLRWLRRRPGEAAALALALGSLAFINAWDFPLYLAITAMTTVACWSAWRINRAERRTDDNGVASTATLARATGRSALLVFGLAVAGVVLFLPFYQSFDSQAGGILPVTGPATRPFLFLVVMGVPAFLAGALVGRSLLALGSPTTGKRELVAPVAAFSAAPFFLWLIAVAVLVSLRPEETTLADGLVWHRLVLAVPLLAMGGLAAYCALVLAANRRPMQWLVFALILAAAGFYLLAGAELFRIMDLFGNRMNTVFKVYYQAWILLGIAGGVGIYYIVAGPYRLRPSDYRLGLFRALGVAWAGLAAGLILASAYYPVAAVLERTAWFQGGSGFGDNTLAGLNFLRRGEPGEYDAIVWLNDEAGPGRIVEAVGDGYSSYGRISGATGRATVLGWEGHQRQWRGDDSAFAGRSHDVEMIYRGTNGAETRRLLEVYGVRWLIVGPREREAYGDEVDERMEEWTAEGWLTPAFSSDDVTIYEVVNN